MWVEVLAQWRGLQFDAAGNTLSFWEHYSPILVENVDDYVAPADVSTALYVVWVANADMYKNISTSPGLVYNDTVLSVWTNNNNAWISNHYTVITNLYAKGVRALVMPDAGDLTKTPNFAPGLTEDERRWIRERTIEFNAGFRDMLDTVASTLTDLTIYLPDMFSLFDAVLADPAAYGMINPGVGALNDPYLGDYSLDGPGANYVFWDHIHPTAKLQMLVAETVQELIWPIAVESVSSNNGTNDLHVANVPIGRDGLVRATSDFVTWTNVVLAFESTNTSQTLRVPVSGPSRFYRLEFPFQWVWP
jgi:phospholipase/lecithinase/hemolysin